MAYRIGIKPKALKALEHINDPYYSKIKGRDGYRIRVAHYRIIYEIYDDILLVEIINLRHRKDVYE
jgi:mRNA interferase RelE/StbE